MPVYLLAVPPSIVGLLFGVAAVLAVVRANASDLPAVVRAIFGRRGPDDDDKGNDSPSLPRP